MSINGERNKELKRTQKRNELREKKKLKTVYTNPHKNAFFVNLYLHYFISRNILRDKTMDYKKTPMKITLLISYVDKKY